MSQQQAKTAGEQLPGGARDRSIRAARVIVCGATDLSPVCMGAALHFDSWVPNFGIQEYMRHTKETDEVFPHSYYFDDGRLHVDDTPGTRC
jgi:mannonate dehydratase